jgi:hypothetical protein
MQGEIKVANRSSENLEKFRQMGTRVRNPNLILEEIMRKLNFG